MITDTSIVVARARFMLGVEFLHQGRNALGIDCVGLCAYAYDYDPAAIPAYPRDPYQGELEREMGAIFGPPVAFRPVTAADLQEGDLTVIAYGGPMRHVGIVAKHPHIENVFTLIHTDSSIGKVVEHSIDFKWLRRIERLHRL